MISAGADAGGSACVTDLADLRTSSRRIRSVAWNLDDSSQGAAVSGLVAALTRMAPGITRARIPGGFPVISTPAGAENSRTRRRCRRIRPARSGSPGVGENVWISPDPLGHIEATGVDSRDRLQYISTGLWRVAA